MIGEASSTETREKLRERKFSIEACHVKVTFKTLLESTSHTLYVEH